MRTRRGRIVLVVVVVAAVVAGAWLLQDLAGGREASNDASRPPAYTVAVTKDGAVLRRFSVADLRALPQTRVVIDGKEQDGPSLPAVLAAAGAGRAASGVTVIGAGLRDVGKLVLPPALVTDQTVIDFSERGTVKVCSPKVAWARWVRDVKEIRVD